ncbi:hypothetical protein BDZ89DRAFT_1054260, partial [Hymenopellis radicata]
EKQNEFSRRWRERREHLQPTLIPSQIARSCTRTAGVARRGAKMPDLTTLPEPSAIQHEEHPLSKKILLKKRGCGPRQPRQSSATPEIQIWTSPIVNSRTNMNGGTSPLVQLRKLNIQVREFEPRRETSAPDNGVRRPRRILSPSSSTSPSQTSTSFSTLHTDIKSILTMEARNDATSKSSANLPQSDFDGDADLRVFSLKRRGLGSAQRLMAESAPQAFEEEQETTHLETVLSIARRPSRIRRVVKSNFVSEPHWSRRLPQLSRNSVSNRNEGRGICSPHSDSMAMRIRVYPTSIARKSSRRSNERKSAGFWPGVRARPRPAAHNCLLTDPNVPTRRSSSKLSQSASGAPSNGQYTTREEERQTTKEARRTP